MALTKEQILNHFDELIAEGNVLPLEHYSNNDFPLRGKYIAWKAHCLSFLKEVFATNNEYYNKVAESFDKRDPKLEKIYALELLKSAKAYYQSLQPFAMKEVDKFDKSYDLFISYYQGTGFVFAEYLRNHAKDFNRTVFLDRKDIRKDIMEDTDEWRFQVDQGIAKSKNFILIMTLGFNNRAEIKREWEKAIENGTRRFLFKKDGLENNDLVMRIDCEKIDFSKYNYTSFNNACDLLESVEDRIRQDSDLYEKIRKSENKTEKSSTWNPLPKVNFTVAQQLLRTLHFPQVGWEAYNDSPFQLNVRIEVHPFLGKKDLHPLSDNHINGDEIYSVYPVAPNSYVFANGCFTLPEICATSNADLYLEIRATVEDTNSPHKGKYSLIPSRWKYIRQSNVWSYHPQQIPRE
jgi:hypothetical protein